MSATSIKGTQTTLLSPIAPKMRMVSNETVEVPSQRVTAFSRAKDFALLLVPAVAALSVVLWRDGDGSVVSKLLAVFQLILGVGGSLSLVFLVEGAAQREEEFSTLPLRDRMDISARLHGGYVEYTEVLEARSAVTGGHPEDMNGMPPRMLL